VTIHFFFFFLATDVFDFENLANNSPQNRDRIVQVEDQPWKIFTVKGKEGFFFIVNPFSTEEQLNWVNECLTSYPNPPHISNLTQFHGPVQNIFQKEVEEAGGILSAPNKNNKNSLLYQLRWVTIGCHYNWTTNKYELDKVFPFPPSLKTFSIFVANKLGWKDYRPEAGIVNYYRDGTHTQFLFCFGKPN
jgi:alkylated DNA repair protein alkB family protein 1